VKKLLFSPGIHGLKKRFSLKWGASRSEGSADFTRVRQASSSKEGDERAQDQTQATRANKGTRARREAFFIE
jgi:hypothetical protein